MSAGLGRATERTSKEVKISAAKESGKIVAVGAMGPAEHEDENERALHL